MKRIVFIFLLLGLTFCASAQKGNSASELTFRPDGHFRIMQLTDLHYTDSEQQSGHVPAMLVRLIEREKPDLIVLTGDLIYSTNAEKTIRHICGVIAKQGVPYAITLGNHDAEQGLTRAQVYQIVRTLPGCINATHNPELERQGTFLLPIKATDGTYGAALYIMDSNDYNADDHSYAGINNEQVAWYMEQSEALEARCDRKVNSLVFIHIPLPEYATAFDNDPQAVGFRLEKECPGRDNHGMFAALTARGDVTGVFAGHDHSNNYIALMQGIALGYGRYSGGFGEYQDLLSGARMIELRQDRRGFTTWERLANGRELRKTTFPKE
ncbi:MAG: metallophosphoesterase family protein [Alistipes sp.]